jgi:drug/metabolite transporter (DMT)-like permease
MDPIVGPSPAPPSAAKARAWIALAALLWSTSGAFTKLLTQPTALGLNVPALHPLEIAFFRVFLAGLVLLPTVPRRERSWRPLMLPMALSFGAMNACYIAAQAWGTAANAVLLQYTAPLWMYLASVWWLGEAPDRRSFLALGVGLIGIGVILAGGRSAQLPVMMLGLGSGLGYAAVVIFLRILRNAAPRWLTALNHLAGALALVPFFFWQRPTAPSAGQYAILILFGTVQMALPYWLMARGLRSLSAQEAGTITLLEPIFNPLWAYLVSPQTEAPTIPTLVGGACILGALLWRYWPFGARGQEGMPAAEKALRNG